MKTFVLASLCAAFFAVHDDHDKAPKVSLGHKAPEFKLHSIEGKESSFAEISKEKITVVDFWSVNCPVSKGYEERLKAVHEEYAKKGVNFVIINSNSTEAKDAVKEYMEKTKLPYHVYLDPRSGIADLFEAKTTPHIYVFNKEGVLAYMGAIDDDSKGEKKMEERKNHLRSALDALLAGKKPEVESTKPVGCSIKRPKA